MPSTKEASPKAQAQKARLDFARAHADKDEDYWDSILWSDETKINVFGTDGFKTVWRRKGKEYKEKCMVPTVKHGGSSVLMWGCMSAAGVGELHFIDGIMNSQMYCSILKEKMLPSLRALGRRALFQHDNDPKHTSKATVGFLKKNRVNVIQWPSMSPDLNPIEHLHLHLVILQTLLSKATYNWGIHKVINLEEANKQRKCP